MHCRRDRSTPWISALSSASITCSRKAVPRNAGLSYLPNYIYFSTAFQIMNRLAGAKQASLGETSCLLQNHIAWVKCSETSDTPRTLPWPLSLMDRDGVKLVKPLPKSRKVHRHQILVTTLKLKSGFSSKQTGGEGCEVTHLTVPLNTGQPAATREPVIGPAELPERERGADKQMDWHIAGSGTRGLADMGGYRGCHVDRIVAEAKEREQGGPREMPRTDQGVLTPRAPIPTVLVPVTEALHPFVPASPGCCLTHIHTRDTVTNQWWRNRRWGKCAQECC